MIVKITINKNLIALKLLTPLLTNAKKIVTNLQYITSNKNKN